MKQIYTAKILENKQIASGIFELLIKAEGISYKAKCGQFISIYIDDGIRLLPRPISICEILDNSIRLIYRIEGEGTRIISKKLPGESLRILAPLGNGFKIEESYQKIAIFGGGIGTPPLLGLAKTIKTTSPTASIDVFLGFLSQEVVVLEQEFKNYASVFVSTDDGSYGYAGNVIQNFQKQGSKAYDAVYACGPNPMLKAVAQQFKTIPIYLSLEERMACTIGACLACVVKKQDGSKGRVCVDGPVFEAKELLL